MASSDDTRWQRQDQATGWGRNSSVGSAWARCPQHCGFDPPLGTFSGRGDFSLGVSMGSNSIPPKTLSDESVKATGCCCDSRMTGNGCRHSLSTHSLTLLRLFHPKLPSTLSLSLCLSLSLTLSHSVSLSPCLSVSHSLFLFLSLSLCGSFVFSSNAKGLRAVV